MTVVLRILLPLLAATLALGQETRSSPSLTDMSIEELMLLRIESIYGASGFKQKVTEAPASVTIIGSEDIQKYGYRTLADILRNVPGFYVTYDRNYSYLGVRGFGLPGQYNNNFALLVDGHRLNDSIYDGSLIGSEFPLDVDLIERVEVIRGPNSSLYLASAFLGVINVITKRGRDLPRFALAVDAASYQTYKGRVTYGNKFANGLELLLSGSFYDSDGQNSLFFKEFDNPASNHGQALHADGDDLHQFFSSASWGSFTLRGMFGSRDKTIPTASFGSAFDVSGTHTVDARGYVELTYERQLVHEWTLSSRTSYDLFDNDGTYEYDYSATGGPSRVLNKNFAHAQWWSQDLTLSKQVFGNQRWSVGAQFRENFQQDQGNYDLDPFVQYFNDSRTSHVFSFYAQDEIRLRKNVILNIGLRYDRYSTFGGTTNPRAALIYNPWENTTLKFLYGQSFRPPNLFELDYNAPGNQGNPSLRPQTVKTMELVWEQYLPRQFLMTVSGFNYPIRGLINQQVDPANGNAFFANAGSLNLKGLDFAVSRSVAGGLRGRLSYSFQGLTSTSTQVSVTNAPKHLIQASLSVPIVQRQLFASIDLQYVSRRATLAGIHTGAYVVPNFTLFRRSVSDKWELSASLYNAFNRRYADPIGFGFTQSEIVQDGRTFRIKVGYTLR